MGHGPTTLTQQTTYLKVGTNSGSQVSLVDDQHVTLCDAWTALPGDLVSAWSTEPETPCCLEWFCSVKED